MTWEIRIPYRDRSDSLADVACDAASLPAEDGAIVAELVLEVAGQCSNVGELLDKLEATPPERRRALLDKCRQRAGLDSTASVDTAEEHEAYRQTHIGSSLRDSQGRTAMICCVASCDRVGHDPALPGGAIGYANATRWACSEHEQHGDFTPWDPTPRVIVSPSGALIERDPAENARQKALAERLAAEHDYERACHDVAQRDAETARRAADRRTLDELPPHWKRQIEAAG